MTSSLDAEKVDAPRPAIRLVPKILVAIGLLGVGAIAFPQEPALAQSHAVSAADIEAIASASVSAANEIDPRNIEKSAPVAPLTKLADALIAAGYEEAARNVIDAAVKQLNQPSSLLPPTLRGSVVVDLVRLGDTPAAWTFATADPRPQFKAPVLGNLGVALAQKGDLDGAQRALAEIQSILPASPQVSPDLPNPVLDIALALAAAKATKPVLDIVERLQDRLTKVTILSRLAVAFCMHVGNHKEGLTQGADLARRASEAAHAAIMVTRPYVDRSNLAAAGAEGIAVCKGIAEARTFISGAIFPGPPYDPLFALVDKLIEDGRPDLGRALIPSDEMMISTDWANAAKRLQTLNERQLAVDAARKAIVKAANENLPKKAVPYPNGLTLLPTFDLAVSQGAYDDALRSLASWDPWNQTLFRIRILQDIVGKKDRAALDRLLPGSIDALSIKIGPSDARPGAFLFELARTLGLAGYQNEAGEVAERWRGVEQAASEEAERSQAVELQALSGDFDGAVVKAAELGSMAEIHNPPPPPITATMSTAEQVARMIAMKPRVALSPRALVLGKIASDMAVAGKIQEALKAETELENDPDHSLSGLRDRAWTDIARAQAKSGDLHAGLETTRRITVPVVRLMALVDIAKAAIGS